MWGHIWYTALTTRLYQYILQDLREGEQTNQAQISLRRDICSETISQVVICGIIASPTHKCMGVCMRCVSVCVAYGGPRSVRLIAWQDYKFCGALPPC